MPTTPDDFRELLTRPKKALAYLALVRQDGSPHVTPVWFDFDGTHIIINTARGRVKDKILHKHPRVAMAIQDPAEIYRCLSMRGKVVEETEVGGYEMICNLAEKYTGKNEWPKPADQVRVTYKILPESFSEHS